ncbi:MAG TPA: phosphohistidine phosphatase SixA [Dissulfurispiraceae bacterium]|nr:phosphohistidine phosphatase SixA [Dissulfurispiraceae bacterium]
MDLYLVQHAKAKNEEVDPARPLCEKGLADITKVASYISGLNIGITEIFHSPKLRAKQTAQILADYLRPLKGSTGTDGLKPNDDPTIWSTRSLSMTDNIMLVGHLPHLGKLTSLLLCGDPYKNVVSFKMAGVTCLKRDENRAWSLQWIITPEILL